MAFRVVPNYLLVGDFRGDRERSRLPTFPCIRVTLSDTLPTRYVVEPVPERGTCTDCSVPPRATPTRRGHDLENLTRDQRS